MYYQRLSLAVSIGIRSPPPRTPPEETPFDILHAALSLHYARHAIIVISRRSLIASMLPRGVMRHAMPDKRRLLPFLSLYY